MANEFVQETNMRPKETIIVGVDAGDTVVCMPEDFAYEQIRLHRASSARTWGEFRRLAPPASIREIHERLDDGSDSFIPDDDEPFDWYSLPGVGDGDWPPWPQQLMLDWLPIRVRELGTVRSSALNGNFLEIEASKIDAVVAELERAGYRVIRNDDAVDFS